MGEPMEVIIRGRTPLEPKDRVLAIELAMEAICREAGEDPADGTMVMLTAAVHLASGYTPHLSVAEMGELMATALGHAIIAADDFFNLRLAHPASPSTVKERT